MFYEHDSGDGGGGNSINVLQIRIFFGVSFGSVHFSEHYVTKSHFAFILSTKVLKVVSGNCSLYANIK